MRQGPPYKGLINPSWIRRWFMRQDDFTLWCIGFVWAVTQLAVSITIFTLILKGVTA